MSVPKGVQAATHRLAEFVTEHFPVLRWRMTKEETALAVHLRGNEVLYRSLRELLEVRLRQRSLIGEPADPMACKSMIARDRELQWLLARLETIYRSPVNQPQENGEPPA